MFILKQHLIFPPVRPAGSSLCSFQKMRSVGLPALPPLSPPVQKTPFKCLSSKGRVKQVPSLFEELFFLVMDR